MTYTCEGITKYRPFCWVSESGPEFLHSFDALILKNTC
ncbi:hypothetical protein AHiyo6_06780 [Arthrobacter sp. Hiyo6]|nr:hypothetical protein AHiyo6_06780 [Arthrobacter sp. Hiyo6]